MCTTKTVQQIRHADSKNVLILVLVYVDLMLTAVFETMFPSVFATKDILETHLKAVKDQQVGLFYIHFLLIKISIYLKT